MKASKGFRPRPWAFIMSLIRRRLTLPFPESAKFDMEAKL